MNVISKALQPFVTVAVACPRRDMMRIWPLPVVDARFEDWWEGVEIPKEVDIDKKYGDANYFVFYNSRERLSNKSTFKT